MADLKSFNEMGVSAKPLEEMVKLTESGEKFTFWCIASVVCFIMVMLAECGQRIWMWWTDRKKSETPSA